VVMGEKRLVENGDDNHESTSGRRRSDHPVASGASTNTSQGVKTMTTFVDTADVRGPPTGGVCPGEQAATRLDDVELQDAGRRQSAIGAVEGVRRRPRGGADRGNATAEFQTQGSSRRRPTDEAAGGAFIPRATHRQ
jgi:hypothetical protein